MASQIVTTKTPKQVVLPPESGYRYEVLDRPEFASEDRASWAQIQRILRKRWRLCLAFAVGLEALLLLLVLVLHNKYQAQATLEIASAASDNVALKENYAPITPAQQDYLDTQSEILRSDYLALKVIQELHLDQNPTFFSPSFIGRMVGKITGLFSPSRQQTPDDKIDGLLKSFRDGLAINQVKNSHLVNVTYESRDPRLSTQIVN